MNKKTARNFRTDPLGYSCQQHVNIKQVSQKIEKAGIANVRRIWKSPTSTNKNHDKKDSPLPRRNWKSPSSTNKNHDEKTPPGACYRCGQFHCYKGCPYKYKICRNCNNKGHKMPCCKKIKQSRVKITQIDNQEQNIRKYLYVKIQNKKVKMQLGSGSDISIINIQTWKNIAKPTLLKFNKIASTVTGRKINFLSEGWLNIHFNNKIVKNENFRYAKH